MSQEDLAILKQKGLGRGVDASDSAIYTLQTGEECIRKTIDDGPEKNIQQSLYPSETIQKWETFTQTSLGISASAEVVPSPAPFKIFGGGGFTKSSHSFQSAIGTY